VPSRGVPYAQKFTAISISRSVGTPLGWFDHQDTGRGRELAGLDVLLAQRVPACDPSYASGHCLQEAGQSLKERAGWNVSRNRRLR